MTGLGELLGKLFYYVHTTLGGFYTGLLLAIVALIGGAILGSFLMFWLIAFISTRIRRANDFPLKDHITSLGYEISGKRFIKAPHVKTVKESMTILLDAILWTLFKWKTVQYRSETKNRAAFYTVTGMVMILTLGSFVSTSDAFMGGVKSRYHHYIVMKNHPSKQGYHLTGQTVKNPVLASAPEKVSEKTQSAPNTSATATSVTSTSGKQEEIKKVSQPGQANAKRGVVVITFARRRAEASSGRDEENTISRNRVSDYTTAATRGVVRTVTDTARTVTDTTRTVVDTVSPDKLGDVVKSAVSQGAVQITVNLK